MEWGECSYCGRPGHYFKHCPDRVPPSAGAADPDREIKFTADGYPVRYYDEMRLRASGFPPRDDDHDDGYKERLKAARRRVAGRTDL